MATYYIDPVNGNDTHAGTATGTAWKTLNHALTGSNTAAGDTVYLFGGSIFREANIAVGQSGSSGSGYITVIGDIDGSHTAQAGDVIVSGWLTNDTTAPSTNPLMKFAAHNYLKFQNIQFFGCGNANNGAVIDVSSQNDHLQFVNCGFVNSRPSVPNVYIQLKADTNGAVLFDSCYFVSTYAAPALSLIFANSSVADYDTGVIVRNCVFLGGNFGNIINCDTTGAGTFRGGGGLISECTFIGAQTPIYQQNGVTSSSYPMVIIGCYNFDSARLISSQNMCAVGDWNIEDTNGASSGVTAGPNSIVGHTYAPDFESWGSFLTGRAIRPFGQPSKGSPLLGFMPQGTKIATGIPTTTADNSTVGTISWTNPNNSQRLDGSNATCVLTASAVGHYLKVTGLGFNLPSTATVKQVRVSYYADYSGSGVGAVNSAKLVLAGTIGGSDDSGVASAMVNGTLTHQSIGGVGDLWGNTIAYSDVNNSGFGVALSFKNTNGSNTATINLDYIRVEVEYTDTATPAEQSNDFTGGPRPAGGASASIAIGALERGNTMASSTSPVHGGTFSGSFTGPGYQDFSRNVDASATTISVYVQYDGSYGSGTLPQLIVLANGQCGVTQQTATAPGSSSGSWNKITTASFTPTSVGRVTVRLISYAAATGVVEFDDVGT